VLDLGIDLNLWPWIWLGVAVFFALIELTVLAGSFVLLPFAVSALMAALLGFYDVAIEIQWLVFAGGGALLWIVLYRYARNFAGDNELEPGVGADRLVGLTGIVTSPIDPDDTDRRGRVTAHGEVWGNVARRHRHRGGHPCPHRRRERHEGHRRVHRRRSTVDASDRATDRPSSSALTVTAASATLFHLDRPTNRELP